MHTPRMSSLPLLGEATVSSLPLRGKQRILFHTHRHMHPLFPPLKKSKMLSHPHTHMRLLPPSRGEPRTRFHVHTHTCVILPSCGASRVCFHLTHTQEHLLPHSREEPRKRSKRTHICVSFSPQGEALNSFPHTHMLFFPPRKEPRTLSTS